MSKPELNKWTDEEKAIIERYLDDRLRVAGHTLKQIAVMGGEPIDNWVNRSLKYWRWTESFCKWCLATLGQVKRKQNATNRPQSSDV